MTNDIIESMKKLIARYCSDILNEIPNFNEFVIELTLRKVYINTGNSLKENQTIFLLFTNLDINTIDNALNH